MASFKAHRVLNFWRGQELRGGEASDAAKGRFGRITALADLPDDAERERLLREAAGLSRAAPAPVARATYDAFSPSCRQEHAEWIGEAKREDTRARRIATTMASCARATNCTGNMNAADRHGGTC